MTNRKRVGRLEGRLFADDGCLFMVLSVDDDQGLARVSCRVAGTRQIIELPIDQVYDKISSERALILDNLNSAETLRRVFQEADGWHFTSREGQSGPFPSKDAAANQLCRHILTMQTRPADADQETAPVARPSPRRRAADQPPALHAAG